MLGVGTALMSLDPPPHHAQLPHQTTLGLPGCSGGRHGARWCLVEGCPVSCAVLGERYAQRGAGSCPKPHSESGIRAEPSISLFASQRLPLSGLLSQGHGVCPRPNRVVLVALRQGDRDSSEESSNSKGDSSALRVCRAGPDSACGHSRRAGQPSGAPGHSSQHQAWHPGALAHVWGRSHCVVSPGIVCGPCPAPGCRLPVPPRSPPDAHS